MPSLEARLRALLPAEPSELAPIFIYSKDTKLAGAGAEEEGGSGQVGGWAGGSVRFVLGWAVMTGPLGLVREVLALGVLAPLALKQQCEDSFVGQA